MRSPEEVASRLFWWTTPAEALRDKQRFIAQVMTYGDLDDTKMLLSSFSKEELINTLDTPPYGVFNPPAWYFWHIRLNVSLKALPKRFS